MPRTLFAFALAFAAVQSAAAQNPNNLWSVSFTWRGDQLVAAQPVRITNDSIGGGPSQPAFTPDGRAVLYTATRDTGSSARSDVYRVDLGSLVETRVTRTPENENSPTINAKGELVAVRWQPATLFKEMGVWFYSSDGTPLRGLLPVPDTVGYYQELRDGRYVLVQPRTPVWTLALFDPKTNRTTVIDSAISAVVREVPGERAISYVKTTADNARTPIDIRKYDLATGRITTLAPVHKGAGTHVWASKNTLVMAQGNGLVARRVGRDTSWQRIATFAEPFLRQATAVAATAQGDRIVLISPRRASIAVVVNDSLDAGRTGAAVAAMVRDLRSSGRIADYNATENVVVGMVGTAVTRRSAIDALALAQLATEMFPNSHRAFASLGDAQQASGDRGSATSSWQKALTLNARATEADRTAAAAVERKLAGGSPVALGGSATAQNTPVVFTGVSVIPMDREAVVANQTVIVENGRITYVGAQRAAPTGATTIDARGKYLMPAIAEFHAHVPSGAQAIHAHRTLALYVLAGVGTARGMLGAPMHLALRDSIATGKLLGPRLLTSGPSFNNNTATSPSVAAQMVRDQKAAGYDLLKIHPGVPRPAFDSLAVVANALRIPFSGHVPLEIGLDAALTSKYSTIDHLDGMVEAMYSGPQPLTAQVNGFFGLGIMRQLDQSRFNAIVGRVKASGVAMVPTQILLDNYASDATGDVLTALPEFRYWVPQQVEAWRMNKNNYLANPPVSREQRQEFTALRRRLLKALYDAGVPFLLGSDAPQLWNVPGFSAHRELGALVAAGLSPYQALRTGTVDVAKFMNEDGRAGVVRAGARADLILLDANPLESIANSLRINGVVMNGRWIGPAERTRMLEALVTP